MADYKHGVYGSEQATSLRPPNEADSAITLIVGTSPVNMTDTKNVNKIGLYYTKSEAVAALGYVPPKYDESIKMKRYEYSISETIDTHFTLNQVAPLVVVNVLDPETHKTNATTSTVTLDSKKGTATIAETGIIPESVTIGDGLVSGTDYIATFDEDGNLVITSLKDTSGTFKCEVGKALTFSAEKLDPAAVTEDDIIGGVDINGNKSGMELIDDCYPRFRVIPGQIIAPGYSGSATVAAVMAAKASNINTMFKAMTIVDIPVKTVKKYSDAPEWKNTNNIVDKLQIACYPALNFDGVYYNQSTQLAGLIAKVDGEHDNVPYVSPSNKGYQMTGMVDGDGKEVVFGIDVANYLNGNGITTALNWNGWVCWGNRTACYPANTDVKDNFITNRRMFNWIHNTLILTYWSQVDDPMNRRLIDSVVDSANQWLAGLAAAEQIYGGRVEFLETDNPTINLMDGKIKFRVFLGTQPPAEAIEFVMEYDVSYFQTLFN